MIHIIGCATDSNHGNVKLLQQKIDLYLLPMYFPFDWEGYSVTYSVSEYIKDLSDDELILITDTFDVFPLNGCNKTILENKIKEKFDLSKVVFGGEANCFPDGHLANRYPDHIPYSKWKFINGGGYFGTVKLIKYIISKTLSSMKGSMNQREYTKFFLENPKYITIDYTCEIFQTLYDNKDIGSNITMEDYIFLDNNTIINKTFNTKPLLFHGNGKMNMSPLIKYITN